MHRSNTHRAWRKSADEPERNCFLWLDVAVLAVGQQLIAQGGSHSPSIPFSANTCLCGQQGSTASAHHLLQVRVQADNMRCAHPRLVFAWGLAHPAKPSGTRKVDVWCPSLQGPCCTAQLFSKSPRVTLFASVTALRDSSRSWMAHWFLSQKIKYSRFKSSKSTINEL